MRALERKQNVDWRHLVEPHEKLHRQESPCLRPSVALLASSSGEHVLRAGEVGSELVRLVEKRHGARQRTGRFARSERSASAGTRQVAEVMMCELVSHDERELLVEHLVLARNAPRIPLVRGVEEPGLRSNERSAPGLVLREQGDVLIDLARPEHLVVGSRLCEKRFYLEHAVGDRHERSAVDARGERVHLAGFAVVNERNGRDALLRCRRQRGDELPQHDVGLTAQPSHVESTDRVPGDGWRGRLRVAALARRRLLPVTGRRCTVGLLAVRRLLWGRGGSTAR